MKKFLFVMCVMLSMGAIAFADDGMVFASDSTYVATVEPDGGLVTFEANPNASATLTLGAFTTVTTIDASLDVLLPELLSASISQKVDYVVGPLEIYVTPTFNFIDIFAFTLPAALVVNGLPFTTITVEYDFAGLADNSSPITITAEMVF